MIVWTVILLTVLGTAILSGVLGMAGGLVLMGVLVLLLPVSAAMIVHGAVQAASNGARFLFLREHVQWRIVPPYAVGATLVVAAFAAVTLVPEPGVVLMLIGAFPWLARATPHFSRLDIRRPATAFTCGAVVTVAQLLAGASGPLLDAFYLHASLDRYQVVASKALTQTLGHLVRSATTGCWSGARQRRRVRGAACRRLPGGGRGGAHRHAPARAAAGRPLPPHQRLRDPGARSGVLRARGARDLRLIVAFGTPAQSIGRTTNSRSPAFTCWPLETLMRATT